MMKCFWYLFLAFSFATLFANDEPSKPPENTTQVETNDPSCGRQWVPHIVSEKEHMRLQKIEEEHKECLNIKNQTNSKSLDLNQIEKSEEHSSESINGQSAKEQKVTAQESLQSGCLPSAKGGTPVFVVENLGALSIADWINTGQIREFVGKTAHALHEDRICYSHFNAFEDINVWAAPIFFHSRFSQCTKKGDPIDFQMNTLGIGSGGSVTLPSHFTVGGALGFYHSHLKWWSTKGTADVNGVYFGPYGAYWFPNGYVSGSLIGAANFYDGKLAICTDKEISTNTHSWDVVARFSGGYDYALPDSFIPDSSLHPFIRLDYTHTFLSSFDSQGLSVSGWSANFILSHIGAKLSKTIKCTPRFLLVPKFSIGWVCRTPVGTEEIAVSGIYEKKKEVSGSAKNQLALGVEFIGMEADALLLALDYGAFLGGSAPLHSVKASIEWSW